jgi:hypothetical protein
MKPEYMMEAKVDNKKDKELSDIALVSYLACQDHKIKKIKKTGEKSWFCFEDTPNSRRILWLF